MPASVVFAKFNGEHSGGASGSALAPGSVQVWSGQWQNTAGEYDETGISKVSEMLHHDDGTFKSPYAKLSNQGPSIVDRRLFFVDTLPHTASILAGNTTNVRARTTTQDNILYEGLLEKLTGVIYNDHLFDVYLGECIAPYTALEPLKAALPVYRSRMTVPLNHDECEDTREANGKHDACRLDVNALHPTMQRRWENAVGMFQIAHEGQHITDLFKNLNNLNKLTSQLEYLQDAITGNGKLRIAYTTSGEPTAAIISDNHAVLDTRLYQTICDSEDEACYLLAIINSQTLYDAVQSMMSQGQFGARDLHKHLWKLPIPRYDSNNQLHVWLSQLGETAQPECDAMLAESDILGKPAGGAQSEPARQLLRHGWRQSSTTAQSIERKVGELLNDPAQAALAERQMEEAKHVP